MAGRPLRASRGARCRGRGGTLFVVGCLNSLLFSRLLGSRGGRSPFICRSRTCGNRAGRDGASAPTAVTAPDGVATVGMLCAARRRGSPRIYVVSSVCSLFIIHGYVFPFRDRIDQIDRSIQIMPSQVRVIVLTKRVRVSRTFPLASRVSRAVHTAPQSRTSARAVKRSESSTAASLSVK